MELAVQERLLVEHAPVDGPNIFELARELKGTVQVALPVLQQERRR